MKQPKTESADKTSRRLDEAARAAWLYYISGKTQDEIAAVMGVSRQSAQRLVSLAMSSGLVKVRIDHPISHCLNLAETLKARLGLEYCDVVPTLPGSDGLTGVAHAAADVIERWLARDAALVMGLGTGRTLRAAIELLPRLDCDQHRIVSLTGNIAPDGSTAYYNVLFSIADRVSAPTFPIPMPVIAASAEERDTLLAQKTIAATRAMAARADVSIVGIGQVDAAAPLVLDGFLARAELGALQAAGAVGEILGWVFDRDGQLIEGLSNTRVSSAPLRAGQGAPVIAAACGPAKVAGILGAIRGGRITGLVTDEATAEALLA
ncbi:sugar-binding transcriptional regulator [Pseudooceanicola pacificus]